MTLKAQLRTSKVRLSDNPKDVLLDAKALTNVDLLILDIAMPDINGLTFLELAETKLAQTKVIVCSGSINHQTANKLATMTINGVIDKSEPIEKLIAAIKKVADGSNYFSPTYYELLEEGDKRLQKLSPQQINIVNFLEQGKSNKEIAKLLSVSPNTVKTHLRILYDKLDVNSRTACLRTLRNQGLI